MPQIPPPGSEIIGQTTNEFGVQIQVVRTRFGDIMMVPHPGLPRHPITDAPKERWSIGKYEHSKKKPHSDMMSASEMRRYLKGRLDL